MRSYFYLILLWIIEGTYGLTPPSLNELMCYSCTNCAEVNMQTPQVFCNEEFFSSTTNSPTPSAVTTTETVVTETSTDTTKRLTTETTVTPEETTIEPETTNETTQSTTTGKPTPPTVAPVETTTSQPTPPNPGTVIASMDAKAKSLNQSDISNRNVYSTTTQLSFLQNRRRRNVPSYTYHCYTLQVQNANDTVVTNRGCEQLLLQDSVCGNLKETMASENATVIKCNACTMPLCNGCKGIRVSLIYIFGALLLLALVQPK